MTPGTRALPPIFSGIYLSMSFRRKFSEGRETLNDIFLIKSVHVPRRLRLPPWRALFACILSFKRAKGCVSNFQGVR